MSRAKGPVEVMEKVSDNDYKVDLPGDFGVLSTFNVTDLSLYLLVGYLANLMIKSSQQGEDDWVPSSLSNEDAQTGPESLNSPSKVQRITHILQREQVATFRFKADFKPSFAFKIT